MTRLLFPLLALALAARPAEAQPTPDAKKAEALARAIAKQLRAHLPPPVAPGWNDFALRVKDKVGESDYGTDSGWEEWADGTATPYIVVTRSTLAALAPGEDALALLLAREHARLALGLTRAKGKAGPATEADADLFAVKLLLRSGYSVRGGLAGMGKLPEKSRPAWLARVAKLLDKPTEPIWREMPAFECGLTFLAIENYSAAVACFAGVIGEFPTADEVWASLGYARLMRHALTNLFDVEVAGHVLGATSSIRKSNLQGDRLGREWPACLKALLEAERLRPNDPAVLAMRGLAYLLHPGGPEKGAAEAEKYLTAAREALKKRPSREGEIELLVNLAVARLAKGKTDDARKLLDEATALAAELPGGPPAQYTRAITFNRALTLAADGKASESAKLFIRFLQTTPRFDPWWSEGYRHYKELCKTLRMTPQPEADLRRPARTQRQAAVLASGKVVRPREDTEDVLPGLPKPTREVRAALNLGMQRSTYLAQGIEIIADDDEIFVVTVVSKKASVPWPVPGRYGAPAGDLRIGMTREEVEALPGGTDFARRPFAPRAGTCVYYPEWELAVVYDGTGPGAAVKAIILGPGPF